MKVPVPLAELSFTWTLSVSAQKVLDLVAGDDAIRIDQVIEFNGQQTAGRAEMPASANDWGQLNWRLDYLKTYLEAKLAGAVASLNREAFAFTDFIEKAVPDAQAPNDITQGSLRNLAADAENLAMEVIETDGQELIKEAKERFNHAKIAYMRKRFSFVKAICDEIKIQYDYLREERYPNTKPRPADQQEWEEIWLKRAPRKHAIPDEILRMFAQERSAGQVASLIVGLELNYNESTVEKYKKPSTKTRTEKQKRGRETRDAIFPEVYGARSKDIEIRDEREKK